MILTWPCLSPTEIPLRSVTAIVVKCVGDNVPVVVEIGFWDEVLWG